MQKILCATDFSLRSESYASARAVRTAKSLGLLDDENISVVHAFEPIHKGMMGWAGVREETLKEYSVGWEREARDALRRLLSSWSSNATFWPYRRWAKARTESPLACARPAGRASGFALTP